MEIVKAFENKYIQVDLEELKEAVKSLRFGYNSLAVLCAALQKGKEYEEGIPSEIVDGCVELSYSVEEQLGRGIMAAEKILKAHMEG